jgi:hypothetical protein
VQNVSSKAQTRLSSLTTLFAQYPVAVAILFVAAMTFNLTDLVSSSIAISRGLVESNATVVALANYSGLSVVGALAMTKLLFILGGCPLAAIGLWSRDRRAKLIPLVLLSVFCMLFLVATLNNVFLIRSLA